MFGNWKQSNTIYVGIKVGLIQKWNKSETSIISLHILQTINQDFKCVIQVDGKVDSKVSLYIIFIMEKYWDTVIDKIQEDTQSK